MKSTLFFALFALVLTHFPLPAQAAEDQTAYADLLKRVVSESGVKWKTWGEPEKKLLAAYLSVIEVAHPEEWKDKNERLAFWINAHNACVMKFISEHPPVDDVMKITGFRDQLKCTVANDFRSLVEMESGVIRNEFREARVHFLLWWGARGGPSLKSIPYQGSTLQQDLEERSRQAMTSDRFVEFQPKPDTVLRLSPIFDWYRGDFGKGKRPYLAFLKTYLPKEDSKRLSQKNWAVSFIAFDWKLDQAE
jgi:hypothetical protein